MFQRLDAPAGLRAIVSARTGKKYRPGLFYYDYAVEIMRRARGNTGRQVLSRARLIRLADDWAEGSRSPYVEWQYGPPHPWSRARREHGDGPVYEAGKAHPWVGKPGFGLRLHETLVITVHPDDTWGIAHAGHTTLATQRFIEQYTPMQASLDHRDSGRGDTLFYGGHDPKGEVERWPTGPGWKLPFDSDKRYFVRQDGSLESVLKLDGRPVDSLPKPQPQSRRW